jgi:hypothetical protein
MRSRGFQQEMRDEPPHRICHPMNRQREIGIGIGIGIDDTVLICRIASDPHR